MNALHTLSKQDEMLFLALSGGNTPKMFFRQLAGWNDEIKIEWVQVREIPSEFGWFENVWKKFSDNQVYD